MGGDKAPGEIVKGGIEALGEQDVKLVLVGNKVVIEAELEKLEHGGLDFAIVNAAEAVGMDEKPMAALRGKRNSSIAVGMELLKRGEISAFVSAGNTGAIMTTALFTLGTLEGVERPAIAALFPTATGTAVLLDVGANSDCKPRFLVQFAQMGSTYMSRVYGIENPKVGLLSNGEEDGKGNNFTQKAHKLLKASPLNFTGNVEGKDIFSGKADVVVVDGFTGNVVMKTVEGLGEALFQSMKKALDGNISSKATMLFWGPPLSSVAKTWDYREYGGVPLLGVKGNVIMAHGRSDAKAIKNAVAQAARVVEEGVLEAMSLPHTTHPRRIIFPRRIRKLRREKVKGGFVWQDLLKWATGALMRKFLKPRPRF
ncbi:MAG: phosphate acyltransferase PlsX [Chloroflexi bacterium]|nr:phosphate acyltransferase PlsX [Chloroflexota bacterium]